MKAYYWFTIAALCAPAAMAEPEPFSWDELRKLARERNPALASAALSHEASREGVKGAYGAFLPKLSLSGDRSRSKTDVLTSGTTARKTELRYSATASLNLFNGLASRATLSRAQAAEAEADASFRLTSANLRKDLRAAYFNTYVQQERVRLNEKALKRQQQNEKLVELKYSSGSEARWNLKKTKAELDRAYYNLKNSKTQLANARETLANLLLLEQFPDRPVAAPGKEILEELKVNEESSLKAHPELLKSQFSGERAAQDKVIARSGFFPSIDLSYSRSRTNSVADGGATTRTNSNVFAISADWNLFNGATDYFKLQEANATHEAALLTRESVQRRLLSTIRTKAESFRTSREFLPVSQSLREAAEEREKTVSAQYRAGLKNYLDWEQAVSQLLETEQNEVKALGEALTAFADMEQALGLGLEQE